jgi:hypothetical protein
MIGVLGFDSLRWLEIFIFTTASRMALGPTQPPVQWVLGALSLGVKRPGREADHSLPSSAEVKNAWSYTSTPPYVFMAWCLVKHRDNFTGWVYRHVSWTVTDGKWMTHCTRWWNVLYLTSGGSICLTYITNLFQRVTFIRNSSLSEWLHSKNKTGTFLNIIFVPKKYQVPHM